ncbi:ABC transporter ATP-binding protein [Dokdonia ponticola]|uniref:ABC transporter ATP-binding protein n=1 Tax=Dokdonia ponticola TaxID=2041041 RepID=A0ABV9I4S3_9FLAO
MSDIILKATNISKQYRLGLVGSGSLKDDLNRWWHLVRGKEDPFLKVGAVNDRSAAVSSKYVWALQDINFEVKRGEILGIIGKNGAGKSTLLKILSRVTSPTTGSIKTRGRIASLLEVGTGFHPELTGKENIFLNGAILGMTKTEIASKIDEIIEFSGCEMYIDTPVKRYSSGMRVRLGFAVAAFLEPDILVIDEVLAVGDAEFQKKAIGKMQDISSKGGRTVIFVSHDMAAVNRLCGRCVLLKNGKVDYEGETSDVIKHYLSGNQEGYKLFETPVNKEDKDIKLEKVQLLDIQGNKIQAIHDVFETFVIEFTIKLEKDIDRPFLSFHLKNSKDEFVLFSDIHDNELNMHPKKKGSYLVKIKIEQPLLKPDRYYLYIGIINKDNNQTNHFGNILNFEIQDSKNVRSKRAGYIFKPFFWEIETA